MVKEIFCNYYMFSKHMKENVSGTPFYNTPLDAVILLSLIEFLNVVTFGLHVRMQPITTNHDLDMAIGFVAIFCLNMLYFIGMGNYENMIRDYECLDTTKSMLYSILTVLYTVASYVLLIYTHYNYD